MPVNWYGTVSEITKLKKDELRLDNLFVIDNYTNEYTLFLKHSYIIRQVRKLASKLPFSDNKEIKILDIGCHQGNLVFDIAKRHKEIFGMTKVKIQGIDIDDTFISFCIDRKEYFKSKYENCNFLKKDFIQWITEEKYSLIICSEVIEHIPEPKPFLDKIYSLLMDGGYLIMTTPPKRSSVFTSLISLAKATFFKRGNDSKKKLELDVDLSQSGEKGYGHISVKTDSEWKKILKQVGFRIEKTLPGAGLLHSSYAIACRPFLFACIVMIDAINLFLKIRNLSWDVLYVAQKHKE